MQGSRKPSFAVVTGVVVFLTVAGMGARFLERQVPPGEENSLGRESAEFLRQASHQRIDWLTSEELAFRTARTKGLPVMLVVGTPWNRLARDLDRFVLSDNQVSYFLRRNFVCLRIDAAQRPPFANLIAPLTRSRIGNTPDIQIAFFTPEGQMFTFLLRENAEARIDPQVFTDALVAVRRRYEATIAGEEAGPESIYQERDAQMLAKPPPVPIATFRDHDWLLRSSIEPDRISLKSPGIRRLWPAAYRFLLLYSKLSQPVERLATSPVIDWIDGGVFTLAGGSRDQIDFDKVAVMQAEMAQILALAGVIRDSDLCRAEASRAFDSLAGEFVEGDYLYAARAGDEGSLLRSARSSFAPSRLYGSFGLGGLLNGEESAIAESVWGLNPGSNPQMNPYAKGGAKALEPQSLQVLQKLRRSSGPIPSFKAPGLLDVNGSVCARLIETAKLLDDSERLRFALTLSERLEVFRTGGDVHHGLEEDSGYLGDYLAYADAKLQDYLASGRVPALESGVKVLRRAEERFRAGDLYVSSATPIRLGAQTYAFPEVLDNLGESANAKMLRLLWTYGQVLDDHELRLAARRLWTRLSSYASLGGVMGSGAYGAALLMAEEKMAVCVGVEALSQAAELCRFAPGKLVVPAAGDVAAELQHRQAGIYIKGRGGITGPFSPAEAARLMLQAPRPKDLAW